MKTIRLSLAACIVLFALCAGAQDVITFKNGEELKAKVSEVGISQIKYKKSDNLNGPEYTALKADVFMIKYENGTKDVFTAPSMTTPNPKGECKADSKGDYDTYMRAYRKHLVGGIVMTAIGAPLIPPGLALSIVGFGMAGTSDFNNNGNDMGFGDGAPFIATGAVVLAAGITLTVLGPLKIKMAKRFKAKAKAMGPTMSFNPIISPDGNGQAMRTGAGIRINF